MTFICSINKYFSLLLHGTNINAIHTYVISFLFSFKCRIFFYLMASPAFFLSLLQGCMGLLRLFNQGITWILSYTWAIFLNQSLVGCAYLRHIIAFLVYGHEFRLFWAKAFQRSHLFFSCTWHSSSRNHF